jgi:hypothetical protein
VIEQAMDGVGKAAGKQLFLQIDGEKARTGVYRFVAGRASLRSGNILWSVDIPFGSRHDASMKQLFLQLRYATQAREGPVQILSARQLRRRHDYWNCSKPTRKYERR